MIPPLEYAKIFFFFESLTRAATPFQNKKNDRLFIVYVLICFFKGLIFTNIAEGQDWQRKTMPSKIDY